MSGLGYDEGASPVRAHDCGGPLGQTSMDALTGERASSALRLNPFALATDTTARFALLIVGVLSSSLFVYFLLVLSLPSTQTGFREVERCVVAAESTFVPGGAGPLDSELILNRAKDECGRSWEARVAVLVLLGVLGVLLVTLLLYSVLPGWKIRRRRLTPLEEDDAPGFLGSFHALCCEEGLKRNPVLLWNPLSTTGTALAFGGSRRSYIFLSGGLVAQYYSDRQATMTVLRHELAHVVNGDVTKTYLALSAWYAFLLAALVPLIIREVIVGEELNPGTHWRVFALAALVYGVRNSVLRAREYYADAWASPSDADRGTLERILERKSGTPARRPAMLSLHPHPRARLRVLRDSAELFRLRPLDAFGAGVFAGFTFPTLHAFLMLVMRLEMALYAGAVAAVVSASLIGAVLGVQACRASLAARASGAAIPCVLTTAAAAAVGFGIGSRISFQRAYFDVAGAVVLLALVLLAVEHWLVGTVDAWLDAVPSTRSGRLLSWAAPLAAGLAVWCTGWLSFLVESRPALPGGLYEPGAFTLGGIIALHGMTPLVVGCLVIFPATASFLGRRHADDSIPRWVVHGPFPGPPLSWPSREPLSIVSALRWASLGSGVFVVAILALHALGVSAADVILPVDEAAFQYAPGSDYPRIALAIITQAALAALVAFRARRMPVLQALLTVPFSAVLLTAGVVSPDVVGGKGLPPDLWITARQILFGVAVTTFVASASVSGGRRLAADVLQFRRLLRSWIAGLERRTTR